MVWESRSVFDQAVLGQIGSKGDSRNANDFEIAQVLTQYEMQGLQKQANQIAIANNYQLHQIDEILRSVLVVHHQSLMQQEKTTQILSEMQQEQQSHYSQVKRERALKEVLFQIETYMAESQSSEDRLTSGLTAELMLNVVDQHNFGTQDLGELEDKRYYDSLLKSAKTLLLNMSQEEILQLQQFKTLYGAYFERKKRGPEKPEPEKVIPVWYDSTPPQKQPPPKKPVCTIEKKPEPPVIVTPAEPLDDTPPMSHHEAEEKALAEYLEKTGKSLQSLGVGTIDYVAYGAATCGIVYLPMFRKKFETWAAKMNQERHDDQRKNYLAEEEVKQRIEQLLSTPLKEFQKAQRQIIKKYKKELATWEKEQCALTDWTKKVSTLNSIWESNCKAWEANEAKRRIEHEAKVFEAKQHNEIVKAKSEEYERLFKDALAILRQQINSFLDDHPTMQIFYKKVS